MHKIYVVAGDHHQFSYWKQKKLQDKEWMVINNIIRHTDIVNVNSPLILRGVSDPHGVFIGTWKDRIDILSIVETLIHQSNNPRRLIHIRDELFKAASNGQIVSLAALNLAKEIDQEIVNSWIKNESK